MATRRSYERTFKADAVRLVRQDGRPVAEVADELGVDRRTLANWVRAARAGPKEPTSSRPAAAGEAGPASESRPESGGRRSRGRMLEERLSASDWVDRALDILTADGVEAVKIPRLCAELGVTRGSFYWHFADLDELLRAVADRWAERTRAELNGLAELEKMPPTERLVRMTGMLISGQFIGVERQIREWARADTLIGKTVMETDLLVHSMLHGALLDLGFDAEEARARSAILVNAGIGFAQGASPLPPPTPADIEKFFSIVVGIDVTIPEP